MEEKNYPFKKYITASLIGLAVAFAIMYWQGLFLAADAEQVFMVISDGFFVVSILYIGFGLLLWVSSTGCLDMLTYGFRSVLYLFTPIRKNRDEGGFYEYKIRQKEKRKPVPFHVIWVGLVFLVLSVIFVILYSTVAV